MPLPPAHQRVTIQGTLAQVTGGGADIFDFGLSMASGMTDEEVATSIAGVIQGLWTNTGVGIYDTASPTNIIAETIEADGKVSNSYNAAVTNPGPGLYSSPTPTFCSAVVTLETGAVDSKGRKVRGRFYPPAMFAGVRGSTTDSGDRDTYRDAWAYFLGEIQAAASPIIVASSTSAGLSPVTGISVDNVADSQRSRKNRVTRNRSAVVPLRTS